MDDEELTRLAIAEIVREMGELPDTTPRERKINPIARPNKRFLGRTLNSMLSHNKRENDRTQRNCKEMLKELDHNRERCGRRKTRSRTPSKDLSLSSSTDENEKRGKAEISKRLSKTVNRKRKNDKRSRRKTKRSKAKRRESSSDSSSSDTSSSSSSQSSERSRKHKNSKHIKHKKHKDTKPRKSTNDEEELVVEEQYYEPCTNVDITLHPALWSINSYAEHQMQQLLQYNELIAGVEASENKDVLEELQLSDADATETQIDVASISSAVSSLRLDEQSSEASEILQISVSSSSSSSRVPTPHKVLRKKRVKRKDSSKNSESSDSSICPILDLDSDSSKASISSDIENLKKQPEKDDECISIASGSSKETNTEDTDSSASEIDNESVGSTSIPKSISYAATSIVMLLTTSESEVEVTDIIEAKSPTQNENGAITTLLLPNTDSANTCSKQISAVTNEPLNLTISHVIPSDMVDIDLSIKSFTPHLEVELQGEGGEGIDIASEIGMAGEKEPGDCEIASAVNLTTTSTLQKSENEAESLIESFEECKTILTQEVNPDAVKSSVLYGLSTPVALLKTNNDFDLVLKEATNRPAPPIPSTLELLELESKQNDNLYVPTPEITITKQANEEIATSDCGKPEQKYCNDLHTSLSSIYSCKIKEVDEQLTALDYRKSKQVCDTISGSNPVQSIPALETNSTKKIIEHIPSIEYVESRITYAKPIINSGEEQISAIDYRDTGSPSSTAITKQINEKTIGNGSESPLIKSGVEQITDFDRMQYEPPSAITTTESISEGHTGSKSEKTESSHEQTPDGGCESSVSPSVISATRSVDKQLSGRF